MNYCPKDGQLVLRRAAGALGLALCWGKLGTRVHAAAGRREHPRHAGDGAAGVGHRGGRRLKARDAVLRGFPEVEMIVGKAGRADTPTDPSPLEMVETVITLRPKELWPKRKMRYADAQRQTAVVLGSAASTKDC